MRASPLLLVGEQYPLDGVAVDRIREVPSRSELRRLDGSGDATAAGRDGDAHLPRALLDLRNDVESSGPESGAPA